MRRRCKRNAQGPPGSLFARRPSKNVEPHAGARRSKLKLIFDDCDSSDSFLLLRYVDLLLRFAIKRAASSSGRAPKQPEAAFLVLKWRP